MYFPERELEALHVNGARFVLLDGDGKRPIWRGWHKRRPGLETALSHIHAGGGLALTPYSLGCSVLDVDAGDPAQLIEATDVRLALPTRGGGVHCWFSDTEPRSNGRFSIHDCSGDVRSGSGYVKLHGADAPGRIADGLAWGLSRFPADLFAAHGIELPRQENPDPKVRQNTTTYKNPPGFVRRQQKTRAAMADCEQVELELVKRGNRHNAIFAELRRFVKTEHHGEDILDWCGRILRHGLELNARLAEPLDETEILRSAQSMARHWWSYRAQLDHSPAAQKRRGVKSAHGNARPKTLEAITVRDEEIAALGRKHKQADIAQIFGITQQRVAAILAREGVTRQRVGDLKPWEADGMTRATWYRKRAAAAKRAAADRAERERKREQERERTREREVAEFDAALAQLKATIAARQDALGGKPAKDT